MVDLGGQWVHGEQGNVVYEMAWPLGLLEHSSGDPTSINLIFSDGSRMLTNQTANFTEFSLKNDRSKFADPSNKYESIGDVSRKG